MHVMLGFKIGVKRSMALDIKDVEKVFVRPLLKAFNEDASLDWDNSDGDRYKGQKVSLAFLNKDQDLDYFVCRGFILCTSIGELGEKYEKLMLFLRTQGVENMRLSGVVVTRNVTYSGCVYRLCSLETVLNDAFSLLFNTCVCQNEDFVPSTRFNLAQKTIGELALAIVELQQKVNYYQQEKRGYKNIKPFNPDKG